MSTKLSPASATAGCEYQQHKGQIDKAHALERNESILKEINDRPSARAKGSG